MKWGQRSRDKGHTSSDTGKTKVRAHEVLAPAPEGLELPHECRARGHVLHAPARRAELGRVCVVGYRHVYLDVVRGALPFELRFDLDHVFYTAAAVLDLGER